MNVKCENIKVLQKVTDLYYYENIKILHNITDLYYELDSRKEHQSDCFSFTGVYAYGSDKTQ